MAVGGAGSARMDVERVKRAKEAMAKAGLDALVCRLPQNVLMLSGYWPLSGISFLVFPLEGDPVCVVPRCEEREAAEELWWARCASFPFGVLGAGDMYGEIGRLLADAARRKRWKRIGYEGGFETAAPAWNTAESAFPSAVTRRMYEPIWGESALEDATPLLLDQRVRKTGPEADRIRRCNEISCFGLEAFRASVAEGKTGVQLAAEVERSVMVKGTGYKGARRVRSFAQVATGVEETAVGYRPMEIPTTRALRRGELALLELAVVADGFWCDRTRVHAAGKPSDRQREVFDLVTKAQEAAVARVKPGASAGDVDDAARSVLAAAGLAREFLHVTGHGTGFQYHDPAPVLAPRSDVTLGQGMIFSVEPGAYSQELGGIRLEDNVLVTQSGAEVLGPFPKALEALAP